jgi:hypothetical protein
MGLEINQAHVAQYSSNVRMLAEETRAVLRQICEIKPVQGAVFFGDRLTGSNTVRRTGRHTTNPSTPPRHDRRRGWTVDDEWGAYIDKADEIRTIIDFKGKYPTMCVNAFNRTENQLVLDALGGPAYTEVTADTGGTAASVTTVNHYDVGESRLIAGSGVLVAAGSQHSDTTATALTIAKLALCGELLDEAGFTPENGYPQPRYFIANSYNKWQLLQTTEAKSLDYNSRRALAEGTIDQFMGFRFIWTEQVATDTTETDCIRGFACVGGAIALGIGQDISPQMWPDSHQCNDWYCYGFASKGATRQEGPAVIQINLKKAA